MHQKIIHSSRAEAVAEQILGLIKTGKLRSGDKLMSEPELVKVLQVGRSSIREAKQILSTRKVIEQRPGQGTFVRQISADEVMDADILHILFAAETLQSLQETREILEADVVGLAAERATEGDLEQLEAILKSMEAAEGDRQKVFDAGLAFHRALVEAAHNRVIVTVYRTIQALLEQYQRPIYTKLSDPKTEVAEHRAILDAIKAQDSERARTLMRHHLAGVRNLTLRGAKE